MKERVAALVGPVAEKMWVSTFHSACVRILRRDGSRLGFPSSFTIYDQSDAERLTGYCIRDLGLDPKKFPSRSVHSSISAAKNDGLDQVLLHIEKALTALGRLNSRDDGRMVATIEDIDIHLRAAEKTAKSHYFSN
jgi:DNA helicase-2/ATP-dependent DNA helicase PcrA